ncbi:MAG4270 family putative restriction endonuclease [Mesoplasma corruscae]|uniref:HNH nuclease domain-containing protein n=1 Tax=Mesoplasma corruscae TaxID=216874 RepID=A0A2S5REA4_9MOLU|nr:HNH endonuclease [Mesoplasma corruscae]PPE05656.1 hypothetical protein MCORR_v1c06830 [Mesoplasma corruscae]
MAIRYLKVEFGSKKYLKLGSKSNKYSFSGTIFYVFNENGFITQTFTQINEGCEYRTNDAQMQKTEYWRNQKFIELRKEIFPFTDKPEIKTLTKEEVKIINSKMQNNSIFTTHLKTNEFLTGSNTSGSETKLNNSPILIDGIKNNTTKYKFYRFINFFKKITLSKEGRTKFEYTDLKEINMINIDDFFEEFDIHKKTFLEYNFDISIDNYEEYENQKYAKLEDNVLADTLILIKQKKVCDSYYKEGLEILKKTYEMNEMTVETFKRRLRTIFSFRVEALSKKLLIKNYIKNSNFPIVEKAHIVQFSYLVEILKDYESAIDPYNCLLLEPNLHKAFDSNEIYFSSTGKIIYNNTPRGELIQKEYNQIELKEEIVKNDKFLKYIEWDISLNNRKIFNF